MICGLTLFGLGGLCGSAWALDPSIRALAGDELLRSYWHCDRQTRISAGAGVRFDDALMQVCGSVSHALQRRRFGGDFGALHRLTEQNRAAAHARLPGARPARPAARVARVI
jgi:hypothetical protein